MPFFGSLGILITRVLVVAAAVLYLFSQISTLLGSGTPGYFDATVAFNTPYGVAVDSEGNVYVADYFNNLIRKITSGGLVTTLAGSGNATFADGTGTGASFNQPTGIAVDSSNNVYVIDRTNNRVRRITPAGVVTTLAGQTTAGSADGTGTNASFTGLIGIAVNSSGDIFVCEDSGSNRIRKITSTGVVTTFVSSGLRSPSGMVFNSAGELYVTNATNHYISKVSPEGVVTNIAGAGSATVNGGGAAVDGTGTNAVFFSPLGAGIDSAGNVYIADGNNNRIRKMTPEGVVTTLAGSLSDIAGFVDGVGTAAIFSYPFGIAVDSAGNVYVGDANNYRIRKITSGGLVTTLAGSGFTGYTNSVNNNPRFRNPSGITLDSTGNVYVADTGNHRIRKITPDGLVSTLAGKGFLGGTLDIDYGYLDGTGTNALFFNPGGVAVDSEGNVYVADANNHRIRKITPAGVVTTFAGSGTGQFANGTGTNASFRNPQGLAFDSSGILYVSDYLNHAVRKITPAGVVTTLVGNGVTGTLNLPVGITVDSSGNVYVSRVSHIIQKITSVGVVTTFAGNGTSGSADGTGTNATFNVTGGVAVDSAGNVYVAEQTGNRVRKITPAGVVSTFASSINSATAIAIDSSNNLYVTGFSNGLISKITPAGVVTSFVGGTAGYSDGGWFFEPVGLSVNSIGEIFVADKNNHRIRRILPVGVATTFAGSGTIGATNATGTSATFYFPQATAVDSAGNVYVADSTNRQIRRISSGGVVITFAGSTTSGFADGTGTNATFNTPVGITVDSTGNVHVCDIGNHNIRRIVPGGVVTSLAGSRTATFADGVGTNASFNTPSGIVADIYGNVYVADTNNHRIRRVTSDGTVTTLAGQATAGYADGIGTNAQFNFPYHLSIDALGTLYVADQTNHRIRTIQTSTGVVATLAGDGTAGFTFSRFNSPRGITVDRFRNAYIADTGNHSIRKITNAYTLPENNGVVTTFAGSVFAGYLDGNTTDARFWNPTGLGIDLNDNLYTSESNGSSQRIRKITPAGVVTTLAGSGTAGFADGAGVNAQFNFPIGFPVDSEGNIYVSDSNNHRIRIVTSAGVVTTFAGNGTATFADGPSTSASFSSPQGIARDSVGNLYIADLGNRRIRKITPDGVVSTLAGNGTNGSANGIGTNATFNSPWGIAVDSGGTVYVADNGGQRIRRITSAGVVTTLAGQTTTGTADGTGTNAQFNFPRGITVDSAGNLFVTEQTNHRIRNITPAGVVTTFAGSVSGSADGTGTNALFQNPYFLVINSQGNIYVADSNNHRIRKIGSTRTQQALNRAVVTTIAGNGTATFLNGTGTNTSFNNPAGMGIDSTGNLYIADYNNHRIRKITPAGVVTTFAGSGTAGSGNGTGTSASFNGPNGVALDSAGNVYIADALNHRIRKITPAGVVTTLAGSTAGVTNATGTNARFNSPNGIAVASDGNVYVAEFSSHLIRRVTPTGVVTTFAGNVGAYADGTGTDAWFWNPAALAIDSAGNLYVADNSNHRIRKITPERVVTTLAGSGPPGGAGAFADGTGGGASFSSPRAITVDSEGNVYVSDQYNNRIRKITPAGVVTTFAGQTSAFFGNGTGTNAGFNLPQAGIAIDTGGILYVSDTGNQRIRKIQ